MVLGNGVERGLRALEFRTGSGLNFDVLVDQAMDIGSAEYRGAGFGWQPDQGQFPSFFQWLHLREGAYAVGFEPSTHGVTGGQAARDDGTMTWLAAGESRTYATTFRIIDAAA